MNNRLASRLPKLVVTVIALTEKERLSVACQCWVRSAKRAAQPFTLTMRTPPAKNCGKEQRQRNTDHETKSNKGRVEQLGQKTALLWLRGHGANAERCGSPTPRQ